MYKNQYKNPFANRILYLIFLIHDKLLPTYRTYKELWQMGVLKMAFNRINTRFFFQFLPFLMNFKSSAMKENQRQ